MSFAPLVTQRRFAEVVPIAAPNWNVTGPLFDLTVAAGTVDADLTDFLLRVDLSSAPVGFWSQVHPTGANVRVYSDAELLTEIPFHISHLDTTNNTDG